MRLLKRTALAASLLAILGFSACALIPIADPALLGLQDGDIILQDKLSPQSPAVAAATGSPYTHVGILYHKADGYYVIDASSAGVGERPFSSWAWRGVGHQFNV